MQLKLPPKKAYALIKEIKGYFGNRVCAVSPYASSHDKSSVVDFSIRFIAYNFFAIKIEYIDYESINVYILNSFDLDDNNDRKIKLNRCTMSTVKFDAKSFLDILQSEIESRIPDKYLIHNGWMKTFSNYSLERRYYMEKSADDIKSEIINFFGDKVFDTKVKGLNDSRGWFCIEFLVYNFFWLKVVCDESILTCSIINGPVIAHCRNDIGKMECFFRAIDENIKLRIPDKYLLKYE